MYERILAIGDIHGEWDMFMSLYEQLDFDPERDLLIFLGDYIDRGPGSMKVLEWMQSHQGQKNIIMLRGNHEQMMIDFYESEGEEDIWLSNGGDITERALRKQGREKTSICLSFAQSLPLSHRLKISGRDYFFCHAGVNPGRPLDQQEPDDLLWIREEFFDHYQGQEIIVAGHTPTSYVDWGRTTPLIEDNMILLDTGSYMEDGHISCVDLLSGQIWRSR